MLHGASAGDSGCEPRHIRTEWPFPVHRGGLALRAKRGCLPRPQMMKDGRRQGRGARPLRLGETPLEYRSQGSGALASPSVRGIDRSQEDTLRPSQESGPGR